MPSWSDILDEVSSAGSTHDLIRRKYLKDLAETTGRNVIVYYSGWLQKGQLPPSLFSIGDEDKNGFMATIFELDRDLGLDLILHTPGGDIAATESLVDYLRSMFGTDIRAIVPQLAMSAGTMISLSCREIIMGKHSSLGPIDPQIAGVPAHGIIEEFERAKAEIGLNQLNMAVWQPIIAKYSPTLIGECEKAITWSKEITLDWLITGMFAGDADAEAKAHKVVEEFSDHALTRSHARHLAIERAQKVGVNVTALEADPDLQEAVLTVHHACIQTLAMTGAMKVIENQNGVAYISAAQQFQIVAGGPAIG